jgi:hypothetical protein
VASRKPSDVVMVPIGSLRENPWNPNRMDESMHKATIENIRRFGFNGAVVVRPARYDENDERGYIPGPGGDLFEIVDGAHRFRAAQALEMTHVPVVVREFTDGEAKAQTIAMNQLRGDMDAADVARLVREIDEEGIDRDSLLEFSGFTADDLDALDAALTSPGDGTTGTSQGSDGDGSGAKDQSGDVGDSYHVIVECADESAQLALAERLEGEGYGTRLVIG